VSLRGRAPPPPPELADDGPPQLVHTQVGWCLHVVWRAHGPMGERRSLHPHAVEHRDWSPVCLGVPLRGERWGRRDSLIDAKRRVDSSKR